MNENPRLKRYYIVNENPARIISKCISHSKGTLWSFLVGMCMIYIFLNWVPEIISIFIPVTNVELMPGISENVDPATLDMMPGIPVAVALYDLLFNGVFKLGECLYCLTYIRNRKAEYAAIAEGMPYYMKTLAVFAMQVLMISFWTMFFIIPGIIVAINLSQAFYILADDPSKGVFEVLSESKRMMTGNRMNYVRLIIFYIPYIMVAYIPAYAAAFLLAETTLHSIAVTAIGMITEIPVFLALGYMSLGRTVFYELLINRSFAEFKYAGQNAFREMENNNGRL